MTKRERTNAALGHSQPDAAPWNIECTSELAGLVEDRKGIAPGSFSDWAGNHCEKISYNIGGEEIEPGHFRDEFGVVWNRTAIDKDIGVVEEYLIPEPDLSLYQFPEPDLSGVRRKTEAVLAEKNDRFVFGKIGMVYFERAWSLRGMQDLMMEFYTEPVFVEALFKKILEYDMQIIETALSASGDYLEVLTRRRGAEPERMLLRPRSLEKGTSDVILHGTALPENRPVKVQVRKIALLRKLTGTLIRTL
jgi:uroporphyrinogen decarboxylase